MNNRLTLLLVLCLGLSLSAFAAEPRYVVTLAPEATAGDPEALATRIARTYGGTVESVSGSTIVMQISPARAALLGRDANVRSIAADAVPERVTSNAIDWNTGVGYEYDGSGNVRKIGTDTFSYDDVGRLVEAHTGGVKRQYEYDAFGNRTKCTQGVSDPCQDTETISASSNRSSVMSYNAAGDVTAHAGHTYTFDEFHMLTSDRYGDLTREFIYNANDQRIGVLTSAPTGSWWRWTFRDPLSGKVLREFTSQGIDGTSSWKWEKDYIWRDGSLLATVQPNPTGTGNTTYHYHLDHLGTPRRITDNADVIVGVHDYHAFGSEAAAGTDERSLSLMKYTGHERDIVDGHPDSLDYMMARYYSPTLGRFLSVDPNTPWELQHGTDEDRAKFRSYLAHPQRWNRYAYVSNNPINKFDPDGREENFYMEKLFGEQQMVGEGKMTEEQYWTRRKGEGVGTLIGVGVVAGGWAVMKAGALGYGAFQAWRAATTAAATIKAVEQISRGDARLFRAAVDAARGTANTFGNNLTAVAQTIAKMIPGGQVLQIGKINGQAVYGSATTRIGITVIDGTTKVVRMLQDGKYEVLGNFR